MFYPHTITIRRPPASPALQPGTKQAVAPEYSEVAVGVQALLEARGTSLAQALLGRAGVARYRLLVPGGTDLKLNDQVEDQAGRLYTVVTEPLDPGGMGHHLEADLEGRN